MDDIAPALHEQIEAIFAQLVEDNTEIARILRAVSEGSASQVDLQQYAALLGECCSEALGAALNIEVLPNGRMYYNIADRTIRPALENNRELVNQIAVDIQTQLNQDAGIGIKAQVPAPDDSRIANLIDRLTAELDFDKVRWLIEEPVINYTQSIADDFIRQNFEFQSKAGLRPKLTRTVVGKCCRWCANLAGVYDYETAPKDVYRRHEHCRCLCTFDPGNGKAQNVWSKKTYDSRNDAEIEHRKTVGTNEQNVLPVQECKKNVRKYLKDYDEVVAAAKRGSTYGSWYTHVQELGKFQLHKSIRSHWRQVELHLKKISEAEADIGIDPKDRERWIAAWGAHIIKNATEAAIEITVWEERYGKE